MIVSLSGCVEAKKNTVENNKIEVSLNNSNIINSSIKDKITDCTMLHCYECNLKLNNEPEYKTVKITAYTYSYFEDCIISNLAWGFMLNNSSNNTIKNNKFKEGIREKEFI